MVMGQKVDVDVANPLGGGKKAETFGSGSNSVKSCTCGNLYCMESFLVHAPIALKQTQAARGGHGMVLFLPILAAVPPATWRLAVACSTSRPLKFTAVLSPHAVCKHVSSGT